MLKVTHWSLGWHLEANTSDQENTKLSRVRVTGCQSRASSESGHCPLPTKTKTKINYHLIKTSLILSMLSTFEHWIQ